ncbi:Phophatidylinositol-4-phosphate 5-kinase [Pseudomonas syringae pv. theae]|uniref:Phophatidylinositol-4-phosphate 5-kinase n=3 Tax=Pseudomonas TaxID=286 RepID=A0A3M5NHP8_PSESX|nr:Uncharacterized protein ALO40_00329 [Pseudomonas syringae pv. viburni]RMT71223.1 Phophatidylinositol-4-phosphate 5-kinase [Pseudomonas syringae pv. theae]
MNSMAGSQAVDVQSGDTRLAGRLHDGKLNGPLRIEENGRPLASLNYSNGALQGMSLTYHPNGKVSAQLPYVNDRLHGIASYYSPEGLLQRKATHHNGLLHGEASNHYPDGQPAELEHYRDGVRDGLYRRFHGNGNVAFEARYLNGQKLDQEQQFAEDGRPLDAKGKPVSRLRWWWTQQGAADE